MASRPPGCSTTDLVGLEETTQASSGRFIATSNASREVVTLCEPEPGSRPRIVWQAREDDPKHSEQLKGVVFGTDQRALFVHSDRRLTLIDAETGQSGELPLDHKANDVRVGRPTPVEGAWSSTSPATPVRYSPSPNTHQRAGWPRATPRG